VTDGSAASATGASSNGGAAAAAQAAATTATPAPNAATSTSEGGTLGSRVTAGVVVEESGIRSEAPGDILKATDTGKGAVPSAPSDLPSKLPPAGATPAPTTVAPEATPSPDAAAVLHEAAGAKVDATASGNAADRPGATPAPGGADAAALQAAHAGTHHDASGNGHREGGQPPAAEAELPAPATVPFHAPLREDARTEAPRLEAPMPRAPEPPEPPHTTSRSEMRLEVASDDLGKVEVRVVVRADGVHATLVAGQDHAREALAQHRSSLEEALGRAQLRLDGFTVGAGPNDGRGQHERFDRSGLPTATQAGTPIGLAAAATTAPPTTGLSPGKGLSLRA
jgi:flagellar hook-length control protein FliK